MRPIPEGQLCQAKDKWGFEDAQIEHAEERVKALDELREKRKTACQ